jgi:hypothetical protein
MCEHGYTQTTNKAHAIEASATGAYTEKRLALPVNCAGADVMGPPPMPVQI